MRNPQCISTVDRMLAPLARLPRSFVTRRALGWLVAALIATLLLARTPLFGVLGFELALAMAAFGSLCGLDLGAASIRRVRAAGPAPAGSDAGRRDRGAGGDRHGAAGAAGGAGAVVRVCDPWFGLGPTGAGAASTALAAGSGAAGPVAGRRGCPAAPLAGGADRRGVWRFQRAAGVQLQPAGRLLPRQPVRRGHPAERAAVLGPARAAGDGAGRARARRGAALARGRGRVAATSARAARHCATPGQPARLRSTPTTSPPSWAAPPHFIIHFDNTPAIRDEST
jgi:hypothetical protein